jgi:hypothetical protein
MPKLTQKTQAKRGHYLDSIVTAVKLQTGHFSINQDIAVDATDGTCVKSNLAFSLVFNDLRMPVSPRGNVQLHVFTVCSCIGPGSSTV